MLRAYLVKLLSLFNNSMGINAVFVSCTDGYPNHFNAGNTKCQMVARGLINQGDKVLFINKIYGPNNNRNEGVDAYGIHYVSFGNKGTKSLSFLSNLKKLFMAIRDAFNENENNHLFVGCGNFFVYMPAIIAAKLKGYRISYIFEEWMMAMDFPLIYKVNAFLMSYVIGYFCDSILPISEYLKSRSLKFHKPILKLPICADFTNIRYPEKKISNYLLYCASASYVSALDYIIESFSMSCKTHNNIQLRLILSGSDDDLALIRSKIHNKHLETNCIIETKLDYDKLLFYYSNAIALLIPLNPRKITDIARFSQKISEYLSSKRPVISSDVGEISYYFTNYENMLISQSYTVESYSELITYAIENQEICNKIGQAGYELGASLFDYKIIGRDLHSFLNGIS